MYNTTGVEQANNIVELMVAFNGNFNDWFFTIAFFLMYIILMIIMYKSDFQETTIGVSFSMMILGIIIWSMGLMDGGWVFVPALFGLGATIKKLFVD